MKEPRFIQVRNPKSGVYMKIDRQKGTTVVRAPRTTEPFEGVEIVKNKKVR